MKFNIDFSRVEDTGEGDNLVPTGIYNVTISGFEAVEMKDNKGGACKVFFSITDGPEAGSRISRFLCTHHRTLPDTAKWAQEELRRIAKATGHHNPSALSDSDELLGKPLTLSVVYTPKEETKGGEYDEKKIKR